MRFVYTVGERLARRHMSIAVRAYPRVMPMSTRSLGVPTAGTSRGWEARNSMCAEARNKVEEQLLRKEKPMTNGEKFKTVKERTMAFRRFCTGKICKGIEANCIFSDKIHDKFHHKCEFAWLDLEFTEEPKPCPFCGHTEVDIVLSGCHGGFDACCKDCGATVIAVSKTMVIEKWNRRV